MAFGLTPAGAGFPPQAPDAFPNYIQFQYGGTDLGAADADTVNFRRGLRASRGTGESSAVITVDANVFTWREVFDSTVLTAADLGNGVKANISLSAVSGVITVPSDATLGLLDGDGDVSVLIMQAGAGAVSVQAGAGVTVNVRSALTLALAGQYAVISLIHTGANEWVVCGDLATA